MKAFSDNDGSYIKLYASTMCRPVGVSAGANNSDEDTDSDSDSDSNSDSDSDSDSESDNDGNSDSDSESYSNINKETVAESKEGPSSSTSARYSQFLRRLKERRNLRDTVVAAFLIESGLKDLLLPSGVPTWYGTIVWGDSAYSNRIKMLQHNLQLKVAEANAEANAKAKVIDAKIAKDCAKANVVDPCTLLEYIELLINLDGRCSRVGLINPTHWDGDRSQSKQVKTWLDVLSGKRSNSSPVITIADRTTDITVLDRE